MGKTALGWSFSCYGNCGLYMAAPSQWLVNRTYVRGEIVHRTDSDRDAAAHGRRYHVVEYDPTWGV